MDTRMNSGLVFTPPNVLLNTEQSKDDSLRFFTEHFRGTNTHYSDLYGSNVPDDTELPVSTENRKIADQLNRTDMYEFPYKFGCSAAEKDLTLWDFRPYALRTVLDPADGDNTIRETGHIAELQETDNFHLSFGLPQIAYFIRVLCQCCNKQPPVSYLIEDFAAGYWIRSDQIDLYVTEMTGPIANEIRLALSVIYNETHNPLFSPTHAWADILSETIVTNRRLMIHFIQLVTLFRNIERLRERKGGVTEPVLARRCAQSTELLLQWFKKVYGSAAASRK
jgi:hypothetical protein